MLSSPTGEPIDYDPEPTHFCQHTICCNEALACYVPGGDMGDEPDAWYCSQHASLYGFCNGCGELWGGIESFEMNPAGLCDACQSEMDHLDRDWDVWDGDDEWDLSA